MASAVPPERKVPMRSQPKLEPVKEFIDEILRADQQAPRKQRHTAHRIWQRIGAERSEVTVAESTVRHYVCRRKQELGMAERETFVPQSYDWGSEAQVDWYEAFAEVMGELRKVYCFAMRSMAGGGAFHRAYYHATQQAFLEAHEFAFHPPGGHAITHQIHRPTFIRPRGGWASYRAPPADPPPLPNPHRQTFLAVEPGPHWLTSIHQKPFSFANSAYFKRRCRLCKVARARTPARQPALRLRSGQGRWRYAPQAVITV